MSLLDKFIESFCIVTTARTADGAGGFTYELTEGFKFDGALALDTSAEARIAERNGLSKSYTLLTDKNTILGYDVKIKRLSDGKMFRITSDGADRFTPEGAGLKYRQVTAEVWEATE